MVVGRICLAWIKASCGMLQNQWRNFGLRIRLFWFYRPALIGDWDREFLNNVLGRSGCNYPLSHCHAHPQPHHWQDLKNRNIRVLCRVVQLLSDCGFFMKYTDLRTCLVAYLWASRLVCSAKFIFETHIWISALVRKWYIPICRNVHTEWQTDWDQPPSYSPILWFYSSGKGGWFVRCLECMHI